MKQNLELFERIQALRNAGEVVGFVDEAGRGPLFGEVVAACVVLPEDFYCEEINDSKLIPSEAKRRRLALFVKAYALDYGIGVATVSEVERVNVLGATKLSWQRAIFDLSDVKPTVLFLDGPFWVPEVPIRQFPIIGGDAKIFGIACASIIAKDYRDTLMVQYYSRQFPEYDLEHNKGYYTQRHVQAIKRFGLTPFHRSLFCRKVLNGGQNDKEKAMF